MEVAVGERFSSEHRENFVPVHAEVILASAAWFRPRTLSKKCMHDGNDVAYDALAWAFLKCDFQLAAASYTGAQGTALEGPERERTNASSCRRPHGPQSCINSVAMWCVAPMHFITVCAS